VVDSIYKYLCCPINSILEKIRAKRSYFFLLKIFYLDTSEYFLFFEYFQLDNTTSAGNCVCVSDIEYTKKLLIVWSRGCHTPLYLYVGLAMMPSRKQFKYYSYSSCILVVSQALQLVPTFAEAKRELDIYCPP
jgi:hypothetical protein